MKSCSARAVLVSAVAAAALGGLAACSDDAPYAPDLADVEEATAPLLLDTRYGDVLWRTKELPYCFVTPNWNKVPEGVRQATRSPEQLQTNFAVRRDQITALIEATWGAERVVNFKLSACGPTVVPIRFGGVDPAYAGQAMVGPAAAGAFGLRLKWSYLTHTDTTEFAWVFTHELGHVLGFEHEQDQNGSPCNQGRDASGTGIPLTGYDPESVMNYCSSRTQLLTAADRAGFRNAYSFNGSVAPPATPPPGETPPLQGSMCSPGVVYAPSAGGSLGGGAAMSFTIWNRCPGEALQVNWVDYNSQEHGYATVPAGQSTQLGSYAGHKWRLRNAGSGRIVSEILLPNAPNPGFAFP